MQRFPSPPQPSPTLGSIDVGMLPDEAVRAVVAGLLGDVRDLQAEVRRLRRALASSSRRDPARTVPPTEGEAS